MSGPAADAGAAGRLRRLLAGDRAALALIFLLALGLRLLYLHEVSDQPFFRTLIIDQAAYDAWAQKIAGGDWLGTEPFYQDPLYPYLLALVYKIAGRSLPLVYFLQALLSSAAGLALYGVGRRYFGDRRAGLLAALFWAAYKVDFFFVGQVEKTASGIALLILALWLLLRFRDRPRLPAAIAAGLASGLLLIYRGNFLLVAPLLLLALGIEACRNLGRKAAAPLSALALSFLIVPALTTLHNYAQSGELIVTTAQGGINLYVGNYRGNRWGAGKDPEFARRVPLYEQADFQAEARRRAGRTLAPAELSRFWTREAGKEIAADPGLFLARLGRKTLLILNRHEVPDNLSYDFFRQRFSRLLRLPLPAFWLAGPFGLAGMALALSRRRGGFLALLVAGYAATLLATYVVSRYRLPLVPPLLLFAAYGLVEMAAAVKKRERRPAVVYLAALLVVGVVGYPRWRPPNFEQSYEKLGNAYAGQGDATLAIESFQQALALNPRLAGAWTGLGLAFEESNRPEEADEAYLRAVAAAPENAPAHFLLGRSLERKGRQAEAESEYRRALKLDPGLTRAREALRRLPPRRPGDD
jgi:4-amino-4-deoxy-L-arabinose transferase-like glycosyltransferase